MKRTVLVACAVACLFSFGYPYKAKADLGDTYNESKHRYGPPNGTEDNITWWAPKAANQTWIGATFYRDQCVCIYYKPPQGQHIYESEIWRLFLLNSKPGAVWSEYHRDGNDIQYVNQDETLYGDLNLSSGVLRLCYASYLKRNGLLRAPSSDQKERPSVNVGGTETFGGELGQ